MNGQGNMQNELETISNFHSLRKSAMETIVMAGKTMEMNATEQTKIKEELAVLKQKLHEELD